MRSNIAIIFILLCPVATAQLSPMQPGLPQYPFIQYRLNRFELVDNNPAYQILYSKFDSLLRYGNNSVKVVHIGGSHIQADIYTHRIRRALQSFYPGVLGSRGFFFPYKMAKTNSPANLSITYTGNWETCKNTQPDAMSIIGLSGMTSSLASNSGSIMVVARFDSLKNYDFNRIRIFCNATLDTCIPAVLPERLVRHVSVDTSARYVQYDLLEYTDTLRILIQQEKTARPFELYGISIENDDPGVTYHTIGVNGAMLRSYLRCSLFSRQLSALQPDWIIISIGTNEGNTRDFNATAYRNEYIRLLDSIKLAAPDAAVMMTVPNDSWLHKRYINHNTALIREIIFDIARNRGCGVWDFYTIMGGINSAKSWYNSGLMAKDHIHFNKPGYLLMGDLFIDAFFDSWPQYSEHRTGNPCGYPGQPQGLPLQLIP